MQKSARQKKNKYSKNETILKIGHLAKAIAHAKAIPIAKWSVWVKHLKCQKHAKTDSIRTLELFCAKSPLKKHQIFEKWDQFENRPCCKGYGPCKDYSLCKMVSLGQKFKMPKTCEKRFYKNIRVVMRKKNRSKKHQYLRHKTILKIAHLANSIAHAKAIAFTKWSVRVKNLKCQKNTKNDSTTTLELFCAKNRSKKHQMFEKWDHFKNRPSCKGYSWVARDVIIF